jgi:hypothetical protein
MSRSLFRLLDADITLPRTFCPPKDVVSEPDGDDIDAALYLVAGCLFATIDEYGNLLYWHPRYTIGNPTTTQKAVAATVHEVALSAIGDAELFLCGGAEPSTLVTYGGQPT